MAFYDDEDTFSEVEVYWGTPEEQASPEFQEQFPGFNPETQTYESPREQAASEGHDLGAFDAAMANIYEGTGPNTDWSTHPAGDLNLYDYPWTAPPQGGGGGGGTGGGSGGGSGGGGGGKPKGGAGGGATGPFQGPVVKVGEDPFSQAIQKAYMDLITNQGRVGMMADIESTVRGILERQGKLDPRIETMKFEKAREGVERARRTQMNQLTDNLAARNLLSVPGIPQGPELSGIRRIEEALAPEFASAVRDIYLDAAQRDEERLLNALGIASGASAAQANTLLGALGGATDRQNVLSQIALATLDRNMAWNQFLAQFGLNRAEVFEAMRQGRIAELMPLMQMFLGLAQNARGGFV